MKWSPDPTWFTEQRLYGYAELCGHALGRAHARSGDAIAICAYLGTGKSFDKAIRAFAESYAAQSDNDFAEFTGAIAQGRLSAHEDAGGAEGARAARQLAAKPAKGKRAPKGTPAAT